MVPGNQHARPRAAPRSCIIQPSPPFSLPPLGSFPHLILRSTTFILVCPLDQSNCTIHSLRIIGRRRPRPPRCASSHHVHDLSTTTLVSILYLCERKSQCFASPHPPWLSSLCSLRPCFSLLFTKQDALLQLYCIPTSLLSPSLLFLISQFISSRRFFLFPHTLALCTVH